MKKILFILLLSNIHIFVWAQTYNFLHLNNINGLSNNQVECIFKDSRGFMWFATNSGLNRYDGTNFKIYKHIKNDPSSIPNDRIVNIQEDFRGNLWLQTNEEGYIAYDYKAEQFTQNIDSLISSLGMPASPLIVEIDEKKNFYFYYRNIGVYKYDNLNGKILLFKQGIDNKNLSQGEILNLKISENYIWVLFRSGLLERINKTSEIVDFRNTFFEENAKSSTIVKSLYIDSDNDPWIYPGVADKGAAYFDHQKDKWIFLGENQDISLSTNFVRGIAQDRKGLIWIATDHGGMHIIDKKKKDITVLRNDISNPNSISQNTTISIFCDDADIVWVGTYKNGLSYYHPNIFKFEKTPLFYYSVQSSTIFDCNSLLKDSKNNLWIGTNGGGLVRYNEQTKDIHIFKHDANNNKSISSNIITTIFEDHSNTLWIGTFLGGLNAFDSESFTRYQMNESDTNSISSKSIYGLMEDKDLNLWIGTLGGGVNRMDASRKTLTRYNTSNTKGLLSEYILSMSMDKQQNIYLSTSWGVNIINTDEKQIEPYFKDNSQLESLTNPVVNYTMVDSRNIVWIATDNGLNIYNPKKNQFEYITSEDGLPSDEVVSLIEDNYGNIWAGTRSGLALINYPVKENGSTFSIASFDENDGLPSSICNQNAAFKDSNGKIYIGTMKGYMSFNPDEITFNKNVPKPRFTGLSISNQPIDANKKYRNRIILNQSITEAKQLILKHDETNFSISFSSLNYIHSEKNHYRYMLEGLDKEWTEIKNGIGVVSYSNLNPGTYKLIVYASNDDNVWTENPLVLEILVKPPFWLTWWAYLIYLLIIGAILRYFIKFKLNKQKVKFEQAQEIMEANKIHEVDELKFRFFTNISHEFKTPLTLILTPLEKLLKEPQSDEQKSLLMIMHRNALNLLNMVTEILEFRKFDLNKMSINLSNGDIIAFVRDICLSFSTLAAKKSIKLTFTTYINELRIDFDSEKLNKIISNLVSNAFKFTEDYGKVDVSISIVEILDKDSQKQLCIKVSDTGIGIEEDAMDKIFERFYRIENKKLHSSGTGVGLHLVSEYIKLYNGEIKVESSIGKGSVFTVLLPITTSVYKETVDQDIIYIGNEQEQRGEAIIENNTKEKSDLPLLLIVDDNEDFREFTKSLFVKSYRILMANDGEEAYNMILEQLPDIILCDVMMPKMDGYELCRKIKEDIRTSHIPIILLTAKTSDENKYLGIEAGADDYISKPFNIDLLTLKISKIIDRQKKKHSNFKKKIDISLSEIEIMTMDEKFVKKAILIVEKNIDNTDFLVEDLGREMGMSRVYFYKKILALTDKSPSEFIRFIRLKRAADLLEKSQLFVNEIAFQVGFNDPKYFRKYFKEEFGVTPNEYKKKFTE